MTETHADLDYTGVLKRAFTIATRSENVLVLLLGAAIVAFGGLFSAFILAGPLAVGYADACRKMVRGGRAELDDVFWRGYEKLWPSMAAGFLLMLASAALFFALFVPGALAFFFSALVFCMLAFEEEKMSGFEAISRVWTLVRARPVPMFVMGLILALIGALLCMTVVGTLVMIAFDFVVAAIVYQVYLTGEPASGSTQV